MSVLNKSLKSRWFPIAKMLLAPFHRPLRASWSSAPSNEHTVGVRPILSRKPSSPSAIPLEKIILGLPRLFPRSVEQSVRDFWDFKRDSGAFQEELLSSLPFFPNARDGKTAKILRTPIDDQGNYINEFCIMPTNPNREKPMKHLILIHGYGAGLGFFLKNLEKLPLINDSWCIHALDLPGYGFSSRPRLPFHFAKDSAEQVEQWFHTRFQRWMKARGLLENPHNNMLVAHSMGAYLVALYANKFPGHFQKLIMCSPAGVCHSSPKLGRKPPPWWFQKLWDRNISPFSLVRNTNILGSKLTSGWSYRRFEQLLHDKTAGLRQCEALHRYAYAIFNRPGSGEYFLAFALRCGGDPRVSLEERMFHNVENQFKAKCDWLWLYGDQDWIDATGGIRASQFLMEKMGSNSLVEIVKDSGHHLYLDNYQHFNNILEREMHKWN
ncbi:LANO_0E07448g1_1 [Lachancea nothofagi CBS 11611]|uniref:LANO_0E07448g1_1 n=1 Tax=Lachancea nothofagi CBS 11611 TaxID=1266666 RepID=A0A1G4JUJ1_9SACH|nr:LANO_0E07448g1_1 [Lachancea nothofagi CBS 11611]